MKLAATVRWRVNGTELDPRMLQVLEAIARRGSLAAAVRDVALSYRHAWGLLARCETLVGARLVALERGRGATLTPVGERLVEACSRCEREIAPHVERWAAELRRGVTKAARKPAAIAIRASHDLALAALAEKLARTRTPLELAFEGSLDALRALARFQCDFAGFHLPESPLRSLLLEPFRPLLADPALVLLPFADRQQGLMVAPGNPLGIDGIRALAKRRARFVNRQPGSGTRLMFDRLLAAHRLRSRQIHGYGTVEFTHAAVAATVASGMADCGFGIEAAARRHGLDFVPLVAERYFLAARASTLARPGARALVERLRGDAFRRLIAALPGYRLPASPEPVSARAALS